MILGKYNSPRRPTIAPDRHLNERAGLIRDVARMLGIGAIRVEISNLLKDAFRIQFDDCTGRAQTLFIPATASPARISQTLRLVSGPVKRAHVR
jgi:hypothetical protein